MTNTLPLISKTSAASHSTMQSTNAPRMVATRQSGHCVGYRQSSGDRSSRFIQQMSMATATWLQQCSTEHFKPRVNFQPASTLSALCGPGPRHMSAVKCGDQTTLSRLLPSATFRNQVCYKDYLNSFWSIYSLKWYSPKQSSCFPHATIYMLTMLVIPSAHGSSIFLQIFFCNFKLKCHATYVCQLPFQLYKFAVDIYRTFFESVTFLLGLQIAKSN